MFGDARNASPRNPFLGFHTLTFVDLLRQGACFLRRLIDALRVRLGAAEMLPDVLRSGLDVLIKPFEDGLLYLLDLLRRACEGIV